MAYCYEARRGHFHVLFIFALFQIFLTVLPVVHNDEVISGQNSTHDEKIANKRNRKFISINWNAVAGVACPLVFVALFMHAINEKTLFTSEGRERRSRHKYASDLINSKSYLKLREMKGFPQATVEALLPEFDDREAFQFIVRKFLYSHSKPFDIFENVTSPSGHDFSKMVEKLTEGQIKQLTHFINTMADNLDKKVREEQQRKQDRRDCLRKLSAAYLELRKKDGFPDVTVKDLLPDPNEEQAFQSIIMKISDDYFSKPFDIFEKITSSGSPDFDKMVTNLTIKEIEQLDCFINTMANNLDKKNGKNGDVLQ